MKFDRFFQWLRQRDLQGTKAQPEPALRSELFSGEQMEAHGRGLAARHRLGGISSGDRLLKRLDENQDVLEKCCKTFTEVAAKGEETRIPPAAEWLLDNYWLVEEQIRLARSHLPKGYVKELPHLAEGPSANLPRVYDMALENISHGDGRLDADILTRFVAAYQTVSPLALGELWAVPIMLRLALVENLRRVALRVMSAWKDQRLAAHWAEKMIETAEKDRKNMVLTVAEMARSNPPMTSAFVAELARRVQGQSTALALPLKWIEELLAENGVSTDQLVQHDSQQQAADQVSIANSMNSLRQLGAMDWRSFVEGLSLVEERLRQDPDRVYPAMDFATRDHYRHLVEKLAKKSRRSEVEVADIVLDLARRGEGLETETDAGPADLIPALPRHVGYYLMGSGADTLAEALQSGRTDGERRFEICDMPCRGSLAVYACAVVGLSLVITWPFLAVLHQWGWSDFLLALAVIPTLMVAGELALKLVNWAATLIYKPHFMPRLDYGEGIPDESRTLAVVPTMFGDVDDVRDMLDRLEVYHLANRDDNLQLGVLGDFKDAPEERMPGDDAVLEALREGIADLNARYPGRYAQTFFACHRPRLWNDSEGVWMGHERKRGKICDFNTLVRGQGRDRFVLVEGNALTLPPGPAVPRVEYVITLDTDTQLPRDAARKMTGSMAHPLNRPVIDPQKKRVVSGYGIMQPRIGINLPSATTSWYSRIFCFEPGIDPYTRAVSDVYQDLFCQGSYIGKGIYHLDAFEESLAGRFPDNRILSHDLIESSYARSGLLSVVELFEDFPSTFSADAKRRHRWVRGDWQLLPWIFPRVPVKGGGWARNTLSALSRWKIADNLRRSMVPPALLALLVLGWLGSFHPFWWTVLVLAAVFALPVLSALNALARKGHDVSWSTHLTVNGSSLGLDLVHTLLMLAWLPFEALYCLDAALRTLWRMLISHRHLLQWNPSHDVAKRGPASLARTYAIMWACPLLVLVGLGLVVVQPRLLFAVLPLALLWLLGPGLAWYMSRPIPEEPYRPSAADERFLRLLARKTWAFFDTFVGPQSNWLPPDNIQEVPAETVAHRTSPTNMGMALLANLAAYDFGYLSATRLLERSDAQLAVMAALERHHGHFYNWYDTQTLQALPPEYISSVDNGNLAGHLRTLRPALLCLGDEPVFRQEQLRSLADAAEAARLALADKDDDAAGWTGFRDNLARHLEQVPASLADASHLFTRILAETEAVLASLAPESDGAFWLNQLARQCRDMNEHLDALTLPPAQVLRDPSLRLPTYRQLADLPPMEGTEESQAAPVREQATRLMDAAVRLAERAGELAAMDFRFLYDPSRSLLSIGYNVRDQRLDDSFYDLLASEARLTYYVGISEGQLPQKSWFSLGRMLTGGRRRPVLLSWSGSMFEYLMPSLVMPAYPGTLLDSSCKGAVARQIEYGRQKGVAWGVSESGYSTVDADYNYQYRAFGVPGLGLKRGLGEDLVIAPYASAMALMVAPEEACRNLQRLSIQGMQGRYGMYEAVDMTTVRMPRGVKAVRVRSFMAHHQGMSLLSLAGVLLDFPMQKRFLADPSFQATNLLLEERVPRVLADQLETCRDAVASPQEKLPASTEGATLRIFQDPDLTQPGVQLLSNGRYHLMVSSGGGGYSRRDDIAVTRWREDATRDDWGQFCYVRAVDEGDYWSTSFQPVCKKTRSHEAVFSDARAEFKVREKDIDTHTEITVSPEDDVELRRVKVTNRGQMPREVELTSYAEVALSPMAADLQHPAFSKLFIQTELVPELQALVASRRPQSAGQKRPLMFHLLAAHGVDLTAISYETDRARFIGRGRSLRSPAAMEAETLSGTAGAVLDPIASIRCRMVLQPGQTATIDYVTGVADSREGCVELMHKFRDRHLADRVFELAWTHSQVLLHQFNASVYDARLYEQLASSVVYGNGPMRADPSLLAANDRGQNGLWGMGISGDNPIVLVRISDTASAEIIVQMVKAHAYWRRKGLVTDLLIWHEDAVSYRQNLHDLILSTIPAGSEANLLDKPGGVFVRSAQQMSREDRILLQEAARLVITDTAGSLGEQVFRRRAEAPMPKPCPIIQRLRGANATDSVSLTEPELILDNGIGGFTTDGREYVIRSSGDSRPPAPWANVIANPVMGTVMSEAGPVYTWTQNAYSFRLTPWYNDPVTDATGEAFYVRDETTGQYFSPTPLPAPGQGAYRTRHGFGYTVYEHEDDGIASELTVFVARKEAVKFSLLRLTNRSGRTRQLSATGYVEWVLGDSREKSAMHVVTEADPVTGTIFARNAYAMDFPGRVAFLDVNMPSRSMTGDRLEFLGRNGNLASPAAMRRGCLSGRSGAGLDPCGAIQAVFELAEGETREMLFILGSAANTGEAGAVVGRMGNVRAARAELDKVTAFWRETLGTVQVETPDAGVNMLANGWLLYQSISSRYFGRSGYYQSGGAYGYRDQLQDVMAMVHALPQETRAHILRSAAHQFPEGDVQHWWHPPYDRGVRTTCSDDYLWLPYTVTRYVGVTGDTGILDEEIPYIEGRPLNPGEESYYDLPMRSELKEPLYAHCVRAITHGFRRGEHGLPLMGGGDWNDGMDRVGEHGKGESVWLGFFQYTVMQAFIPLAEARGDADFAERMRTECASLRDNLEKAGWDGEWYRRAYFDDGTPLGSASNEECRIDSLAQSWSVLSGAAPRERTETAMASLESHLVRRDAGIIQLLTPPFDRSSLEPGYIKGYVPGVRENGGQYTHAAIWAIMAFAAMGRADTAWELLRMVNPVSHGDSPGATAVYKVEPYVVSADVYAVAPHEGRGGWSWYTGASGWLYRLITESLLGLGVRDGYLVPVPLLPKGWESFAMSYRRGGSVYRVVTRHGEADQVVLDGELVPEGRVKLVDDGKEHLVEVVKAG